jgi:hypothetical protein
MKLLTLFLVLFSTSFGQSRNTHNSEKIYSINNKKIKYSIVLMSCDTCVPIRNIGYRVIVKLKSSEIKTLKKLNKKTWMKLLQNKNSDFAANLLLYKIYSKDALLLSKNESIDEWREFLKKEDIDYWASNL